MAPNTDTPQAPQKPRTYPRLDGDDLYAWAQAVSVFDRALAMKQEIAAGYLNARGLEAGEYLLSDDGYIISKEEFVALQRVVRHPAGPSRSPGNGSQVLDDHRGEAPED